MAAKFQLTSPYAPAGDQPKAIEQLTQGFANGKSIQVLLGATGTGKSLAWDEPVLVRFPGRVGRPVRLVPMGELIDAEFVADAGVCDASGTEVTVPREHLEAFSFDAETCEASWKPVTAVSRHAPPPMYRVRTECGREVVVTGDHNFFRLRNGRLELSETADLGAGDYLPLPRGIPMAGAEPVTLDLLELFAHRSDMVIDEPDVFAWVIESAGWDRVRPILARFYSRPDVKRWSALVEKSDPALPLNVLTALLAELELTPPDNLPMTIRAAGCRSGARLPRVLSVGDDLLIVLGLMLAEGHCQDRYSVFSCYDADVRGVFFKAAERLGISTAVRPSSDVQISSRLWTELFRLLVGGKSREKHLPMFWPSLTQTQLGTFLRAYYEGDGGIERPQVTVTTASRRLASELGYALTRLGFWPRLRRRWKRATNSTHAGAWYHSVAVSGQEDLTRFAEAIGFLSATKTERLRALRVASGGANTNVDVVPVGGSRLRYLRETAGVAKGPLARAAGRTRGAVQLIEKQARHPSRHTLAALLNGLSARAGAIESDAVFREAQNLLNARWTPVASVEPVEYDRPFVYDFSVADNETFLSGHGGLFVHNTFTASCMIEKLQKPTLVLAHNKTLAAQLYKEFKGFFKNNAVHYFVSYYDYYQPEAYIPQRDIYIEKDSSINENIDRLRLAATSALVSREDVIIVASVSCIYGLGSPSDYKRMMVYITRGETLDRDNVLLRLIDIQYKRNDIAFERGTVRVRGDTIDVWPASEEFAYRIELFGDEVETLSVIHPLTGETIKPLDDLYIYPAKHFVTPEDRMQGAIKGIEDELNARLEQFKSEGKLLEMERLKARCRYDLDMLREVGYCSGVENYARWFSGRAPGEPPYTLIDFFPEDFLMVVDESHVTLPQVRGMYFGDRSRKETLVEHGFRLPSAMDNRPLKFDEFEKRMKQCICLSATPGPYELEKVGGEVIEQVIRPTGLVDPVIHVKPARGQVKDLEAEVRIRAAKSERTLVTVLTKRMCEDLTTYFRDAGMRCKWLHSELDAIERITVLRELREGQFDVLIGVNLLREGLDLPEVSLVAILDADKEGFLRSDKSLIQTMGRAARNVNAEVILYADSVTDSMSRAMNETNRRRVIQLAYNVEHNITPTTVKTAIKNEIEDEIAAHQLAQAAATGSTAAAEDYVTFEYVQNLYTEMLEAAKGLDFERAQALRDQIVKLEGELKKKHGDAAPPSVLGNKSVPVSQPSGSKKKGKWKKA